MRNVIPVRAKLTIIRQEDVNGMAFASPPIYRMSCLSLRLWIMDPAHINNIALKNVWVQMCGKARGG